MHFQVASMYSELFYKKKRMGNFGEMTSTGWFFHPTSMSDSEIKKLFIIVFLKQLQTFFNSINIVPSIIYLYEIDGVYF